jgi:hypothetical protein
MRPARLGRRWVIASGLSFAAAGFSGVSLASAQRMAATAIIPFQTAPFPYEGSVPETGESFMDVDQDGRLGHTSPRGGIYWEDETYSDNSVLLHVPVGFDPDRPGVLVVYLHGNNANLRDTVIGDQHVIDQFDASGLNGLLVAPQLAVNAFDSSAGRFWTPGAFGQFLDEAAKHFGRASKASRLPVVIIAYSGGYNPCAYALAVGGAARRIAGVVLLDALIAEDDKFIDFVRRSKRSSFFFSAFGASTQAENEKVMASLVRLGIPVETDPPDALKRGTVAFLSTDADHDEFVTSAWVDNPLQWTLSRIAV